MRTISFVSKTSRLYKEIILLPIAKIGISKEEEVIILQKISKNL
jgi:hypothetical protein